MMAIFLGRVDPHFASNTFTAGDMFSIADITGFFTVRMTRAVGMEIADDYPNVARWFGEVAARPAFQL